MTNTPAASPTVNFAWNVPNVLTIIRLIVVPILAWMVLAHPQDQGWRLASTIVFCLAIATDSFDGWYARKYNMVTNWGKLWDAIADKSLTGIAFILLSIVGDLPWIITILILVREWGITLMRFKVLKYGVMSAGKGGKLKTVLQAFAIPLFLLLWPGSPTWFVIVKWTLMIAAFALTILTGLDYVREALKLRAASIAAGGPVDISEVRKK